MKGNVKTIKGELHVEIPVQSVHDRSLTNAELGFLVRLLDKPENWEYRPKQIAEELGFSVRTVHSMFDRLAGKGYIVRHDYRIQDPKTGLWTRECEYRVYASIKLRLQDSEDTERKILRSVTIPESTENRMHALGAY